MAFFGRKGGSKGGGGRPPQTPKPTTKGGSKDVQTVRRPK